MGVPVSAHGTERPERPLGPRATMWRLPPAFSPGWCAIMTPQADAGEVTLVAAMHAVGV